MWTWWIRLPLNGPSENLIGDSVLVRAVIEPCGRTGEGWENKVMSAGEKEVSRLKRVKRTSVNHANLNVKQMIV